MLHRNFYPKWIQHESIRLLIALAAQQGMGIDQMDAISDSEEIKHY